MECEEEDNTLYYRFRGRLLAKQDFRNGWRRDRYSIILDVEHFLKNGANLYPEFMTKSERRNKKLRELFG